MIHNRRDFIIMAGLAPLAYTTSMGMAQAAACVDAANLTYKMKNNRRTLDYLEPSPDKAKNCSKCAFFVASAPGCGTCQMMSGAPVSAAALCDSFASRPTQ